MGLRAQGSEFGVQGLGFWGVGVQCLGFSSAGVQGPGSRVWGKCLGLSGVGIYSAPPSPRLVPCGRWHITFSSLFSSTSPPLEPPLLSVTDLDDASTPEPPSFFPPILQRARVRPMLRRVQTGVTTVPRFWGRSPSDQILPPNSPPYPPLLLLPPQCIRRAVGGPLPLLVLYHRIRTIVVTRVARRRTCGSRFGAQIVDCCGFET